MEEQAKGCIRGEQLKQKKKIKKKNKGSNEFVRLEKFRFSLLLF